MKRTRLLAVLAGIGALGIAVWGYDRATAESGPAYRRGRIERASLRSTVSSTGTVTAVQTVQVGTQVSGQIAAILVDFNDKVRKGQLLARIDPILQRQAVGDAQAGVARVQAQLTQAEREYRRARTLHAGQVITETEYNTAASNYEVAQANLTSARIALEKAKQNLSYTNIYAPIDGVVIERNVDVGQTVAASLEAPQLFLIANDLSRMRILASVDESDIGRIEPGQPVTFTVQSYPGDSFAGTVSQVRLKDSTQNNVVSYTAVVDVRNPAGRLLPGMTATTTFVTDSAKDVLTVPNAALRFRPSGPKSEATNSRTSVWTLNAAGQLERLAVRSGLSDGQRTQVTGVGITEGRAVIVGTTQGSQASGSRASGGSPFQASPLGGSRTGPPGPF